MKRFTFAILALFTTSANAEDWNQPTVTSLYTSVLSDLKARDLSSAKMDYSSATNLPTGVIRWNGTSKKFEIWSGSAWSDIYPELAAHIASTSNPHSTTAAQVGAASTSDLSSHTSNSSNPHSTTAAQAGALAASSNLSDLANASTARSNLSVPSLATYNAHAGSTSNPHSVTTSQIGAMAKTSNLSDVSNTTTARTNLSAAASGVNSDITQLIGLTNLLGNYGLIVSSGSGALTLGSSYTSNRWKIETSGKVTPPIALQPDYTVWPSAFTRRRSLDPSVATAAQCAEFANTLVEDLIAQGELR